MRWTDPNIELVGCGLSGLTDWDRVVIEGLEERYNLSDALAVATYLNIFARHCETVKITNLAQMVNVIAPIFTNEEGLFLQTIYHPLKLCSEHMHEVVLDAFVECETHDLTTEASSWAHRVADLGPFDLLDVSATCDAEGLDLTLVVVNRDPEREMVTTIQLADATFEEGATSYEVTGESYGSINSFDRQAVGVSERSVQTGGQSFEHSFPACSVTILRAGLAG
jgi:alpha-N-arabinofuranosidase